MAAGGGRRPGQARNAPSQRRLPTGHAQEQRVRRRPRGVTAAQSGLRVTFFCPLLCLRAKRSTTANPPNPPLDAVHTSEGGRVLERAGCACPRARTSKYSIPSSPPRLPLRPPRCPRSIYPGGPPAPTGHVGATTRGAAALPADPSLSLPLDLCCPLLLRCRPRLRSPASRPPHPQNRATGRRSPSVTDRGRRGFFHSNT